MSRPGEPIIRAGALPRAEKPRSSRGTGLFVGVAALLLLIVPYLLLRPRQSVVTLRDYTVARVQTGSVREEQSAPGTLASRDERAVYAPVAGRLAEWQVEEGQQVKAGQVLARLESPALADARDEARQALEAARAEAATSQRATGAAVDTARRALEDAGRHLAPARREAALNAELSRLGAMPANDAQAARERLATAEGAVAAARAALSRAEADAQAAAQDSARRVGVAQAELDAADAALSALTVRAPIAGQVGALAANVGQSVAAGEKLLCVAGLGDVEVLLSLTEGLAARLRPGMDARASVDGQSFPARVARISPSVTASGENGARVPVTVRFLRAPARPRLGGSADVTFTLETRENVPTLPRGAFLSSGGERLLYVLTEGGQAERREATFGVRGESAVEVLSGARPGEEVLTGSYEAFKDQPVVRLAPGGRREEP